MGWWSGLLDVASMIPGVGTAINIGRKVYKGVKYIGGKVYQGAKWLGKKLHHVHDIAQQVQKGVETGKDALDVVKQLPVVGKHIRESEAIKKIENVAGDVGKFAGNMSLLAGDTQKHLQFGLNHPMLHRLQTVL